MPTAVVPRNTEGKYRTNDRTKERAAEIYARWGLSLSDAINVFLVKSVEVGGLPFEMRTEAPSYEHPPVPPAVAAANIAREGERILREGTTGHAGTSGAEAPDTLMESPTSGPARFSAG